MELMRCFLANLFENRSFGLSAEPQAAPLKLSTWTIGVERMRVFKSEMADR